MKICSKCRISKPLNEFNKRKESIDGRRNQCKECERDRRRSTDKINVSEKICRKCGLMKPSCEFRKNINTKDNLHSMCKTCLDSSYTNKCEICGSEFKTHHKNARHCSSKCVGESQKRRVYFSCDYCGCKSYERETEYSRYKNHYCSKECKDKHRSELYSGENAPMYGKEGLKGDRHHNWNPNLTDEEREQNRNILGYNEFISSVYKRDNYTCQYCGDDKGGNLNAHHLDGYNWCIEGRTDTNNGITLCENCHKEYHKIYGRGDNTKNQFEEWISNKKHK